MVNIAVILMHEAYHHILIELIMAFRIGNEEEVYVVIWEGGMTIIDQLGADWGKNRWRKTNIIRIAKK